MSSIVPDLLKNAIIDGPDNRSVFVLSEKKATYRAENRNGKEAFTFQIDANLIDSAEMKKCDKGLLVEDKRVFLVELKGVDLNTACSQLLVTYNWIKTKLPNFEYFCRAVVKEMPSEHNYPHSYKKLMKILPKNHFKSGSGLLIEQI